MTEIRTNVETTKTRGVITVPAGLHKKRKPPAIKVVILEDFLEDTLKFEREPKS